MSTFTHTKTKDLNPSHKSKINKPKTKNFQNDKKLPGNNNFQDEPFEHQLHQQWHEHRKPKPEHDEQFKSDVGH